MNPSTINTLKWIAALLVASAGGLLAAEHAGSLDLPELVSQILAGIVAVGSALGIVSSGAKPLVPAPVVAPIPLTEVKPEPAPEVKP